MNYGDPTLRDRLAGEYVLGTLHGGARRRFERLLSADASLRVTVADWENRLSALGDALPAVEPPERVWKQVQLRLGIRETKAGLWNRLDFWRPLALTASALAAALLVYVGLMLRPQAPEVSRVAVLSDQGARPAWVANGTAAGILVIQALTPPSIPQDRALELWVIPEKGQAPRSLGLLPRSGSRTLILPQPIRRALTPSASLAISLEPASGSPTGLPTGPVLYQGAWLPTAPSSS